MPRRLTIPRPGLFFVLLYLTLSLGISPASANPPGGDSGHPPHHVATLKSFTFQSGFTLDEVKVSYVTHGKLSPNKDNVILALQHFFGDHHDLDFLIGPGKALDTDKYFVVATDFLGNSQLRDDLTTGPTNSGLKMAFPLFSIQDSVALEYRFLREHLGIEKILLAIGGSMGAQKAYELAVAYPDFVKGIVPIVGSVQTNTHTRWVLENAQRIIALSPGWYGGWYNENDPQAVYQAIMTLVPYWLGTRWFETNVTNYEKYLEQRKFWDNLFTRQARQDARSIYYQLNAWMNYDIARRPEFNGDLGKALSAIKAKTLIVSAKYDDLIQEQEFAMPAKFIPNATRLDLDSPAGHLICCGFDADATAKITEAVRNFVAGL
jgi:homoserine O-acetyltransferase